jgi:hypothetical protein
VRCTPSSLGASLCTVRSLADETNSQREGALDGNYFVNDVDYDVLMQEYAFLSSGADNFKERFKAIKSKAFDDYQKALSVL